MIIFGIDPGTATTGYGVIKSDADWEKDGFELIEFGCIVTPKEHEMPIRLYSIQTELSGLLKQHKPDCVVVEQLFFGVNSRTAMTVGQARGVVLSTAAGYRLPIFEYQGLHVKNVLTGSGKADKKEIQNHVMRYLNKKELGKPIIVGTGKGYLDDAADALAVAICHVIKLTDAKRGVTSLTKKVAVKTKTANGKSKIKTAKKMTKKVRPIVVSP